MKKRPGLVGTFFKNRGYFCHPTLPYFLPLICITATNLHWLAEYALHKLCITLSGNSGQCYKICFAVIAIQIKYRLNGTHPASFCLFLSFTRNNDKYSTIYYEKSLDDVLGIQTQDRRMEGADKSTELLRPPPSRSLFIDII